MHALACSGERILSLADRIRTATVGLMFMGNSEVGSKRAADFFATGLDCAVRRATCQFAGELAIDHAGPKQRKAAEQRLRQLMAEYAALQQGVEKRVLQQALIILEIHSKALYRLHHQTFDEFLRKQMKWENSRQRAYQLLDYGRTLHELTTHVDTLPSELQVRKELAKIPLPERLLVWKQAVETSTTPGRVTMAHLSRVARAYRGRAERVSPEVAAEKHRVIAILRGWAEEDRRSDLEEIMRECESLLRPSAGA